MKLRPYQIQTVDAVQSELERVTSTLIVLATGLGKTVCAAHLAHRYTMGGGRCLFLAHRQELISQAADKIWRVTDVHPDIEMGFKWATEHGLVGNKNEFVVSSVQTQCAGKGGGRMTRFNPDDFALLIADEAHHFTSPSFRRVLDYYRQNPKLKVVGMSATPDRLDKEALGQVFDTVAIKYDIIEGISDGWLVPIKQQFVVCKELDFSNMKTTAGDLNGAELAAELEKEHNLHEMANPTIEIAGGRKTLFFATSVIQAERIAEIFNRHKKESAKCVFGHTNRAIRAEILDDYKFDRFQFLVNVGVALEGFDEPGVEVIAVGRPTKSRAVYTQAIGRGTRPLTGLVDPFDTAEARLAAIAASPKPNVQVIDFVGNSGRHKLMSTADILGGKYSEEVRARAAENMRDDDEADGNMSSALECAAAEIECEHIAEMRRQKEEADAAERRRREHIKARAEWSGREVNPFDGADRPAKFNLPWYTRTHPISEKQEKLLKRYSVETEGMSKYRAGELITQLKRNNWRKPKGFGEKKSEVSQPQGASLAVSTPPPDDDYWLFT